MKISNVRTLTLHQWRVCNQCGYTMELNKSPHKQWRTSRLQPSLISQNMSISLTKVLVLTNLKSLAFILKPLGLGGFKYPLQNGSHRPLYLNMGGVYKNCVAGFAVGFFKSSMSPVPLLRVFVCRSRKQHVPPPPLSFFHFYVFS